MAEEDTSAKAKTIHVVLTHRARSIVEGLRDDTGIANTEAMARLLEWFSSLDRKFRLAILNRDEATQRELASIVLREMAAIRDGEKLAASGAAASLTHDQCSSVIRAALDRIDQINKAHGRELKERVKSKH